MVLSKSSSDALLSKIRDGLAMTGSEKLNLIVALSMPSILAQITSVLMFYIDASMVGSLGAEASASIGIVEPATWLFGSLVSACSMGFYVQAAHFIGAKDFAQARRVMQHGYIFGLVVALILMTVGIFIASPLPRLLGGGADIQSDATTYFLILSAAAPIHLIENLSSQMLKVSGDMRHPSVIAVAMCFADVFFNFLFIFPTREITLFALHIKVFGFGLGVAGAAIGTLLAYLFACVPLLYYAIFKSKILAWRLSKGPFRWNAEYITSAVKLGAPMALQYLLMNGAQIVSTMIVAPLGNFAIAANSFAVTAESLCYIRYLQEFCPHDSGSRYDCHGVHGTTDVHFRPGDDWNTQSRTRDSRPRHSGSAHRGLRRAFLCRFDSSLQRMHRSRRHCCAVLYKPRFHVVCAPHACRSTRSSLWSAGRMVCHGYRTHRPWYPLPHPINPWKMDEKD